ncbi:unnamed protein product [Discula destructiva]
MADCSDEEGFEGFSDHDDPHAHESDAELNYQTGIFDNDDDDGDNNDMEAIEAESDSDDEHKNHTGFFDDEASEADPDLRSESASEVDDALFPQTFPKFMQLPAELRQMVWKAYCPDLCTKPRVFDLTLTNGMIQFAPYVEAHTAALRNVLAIHHETRLLGHNFAPNLIELSHGLGVAPCHLERDVIFVETFGLSDPESWSSLDELATVARGVQNLGLSYGFLRTLHENTEALERLISLKNLFIGVDIDHVPSKALAWCVSGKTHEYHVTHQEDLGRGLYEEVDVFYIWPRPKDYGERGERSFSLRQVGELRFDEEGMPVDEKGEQVGDATSREQTAAEWGYAMQTLRETLDPLHEMLPASPSEASEAEAGISEAEDTKDTEDEEGKQEQESQPSRPHRISVWPIAQFMFADAVERLNAIRAWQKPWDEWQTDEYESDESEELDSDDSLNDFLDFDDTGELQPHDDDEDDESSADELSTEHPSQPVVIDLMGSTEDDEVVTLSDRARVPSRRVRPRAIAVDSDDLSDDDEDFVVPHCTGGAFRRITDSSDDDEVPVAPHRAVGPSRRARVRARPVDSDDEAEDDLEAAVYLRCHGGPARRISVSDTEDEDESVSGTKADIQKASPSEEEDSSEDDNPAPAPKMSLAKRLRLEAAAARAALDSSEPSDGEDDGYGHAWDKERDDVSDQENGLTMDLAEEGDEEEDGDEEEPW